MKMSKCFIPTVREVPAEADTISQKLMLRAGLIRKLASGIYEWLPLGLRVLKKVEQIVREEMDAVDGLEVWLPLLLPKELWVESGRWSLYGKELFRLKDRKEAEFCLGPTHEEIITDLVRKEVKSYRQLPMMLYQFGTKFRDEIRPRFGVMRGREFYMKDAYSFHIDETDAEQYYHRVFQAYTKICERCKFKFRAVEADSGTIGGSFSHEFMVLADTGEEEIVSCECGYAANVEKAECTTQQVASSEQYVESDVKGSFTQSPSINHQVTITNHQSPNLLPLEKVHTPGMKTVNQVGTLLNVKRDRFIKSLIYLADNNPVLALVRGDYELNELKLKKVLNVTELVLANAETVRKVIGAEVGFAGPVNLPRLQKNAAPLYPHKIREDEVDLTTPNLGGEKEGVEVPIIADSSVAELVNGISGANETDFHYANINITRDYQPTLVGDIRLICPSDWCPRCIEKGKKKQLLFSQGIEVGHTFKLGTKYSQSLNATYLDKEGKPHLMVMGCYGIGVSRIVAAVIEQSYDENGIIWPVPLAPYKVIIVPVVYENQEQRDVADKIYTELIAQGIEVLLDDRTERAGVKFKDADLIGIPVRITVSERGLKNSTVELKLRAETQPRYCPVSEVVSETIRILSLQG